MAVLQMRSSHLRNGIFILFSQLLLGGFALAHAQPKAESVKTHEYRLANGLKLIVREDHRAPTVAHMVWYKAGSMDETNGRTGVAHVLEHMMFKGTHTVKSGDFSKRVAAMGGRENAFTSMDYTAYFQQIERSKLAEVMRLEADRMNNLNFDDAEFAKEIQVVMEERRLHTEDEPSGLLYENLMATAFKATPYRHPIIGWMNDLENMVPNDSRQWYRDWYAPNNATVVIAGDVDPEKVRAIAEATYGKLSARELPVRKPQLEPPQKGKKQVIVKAPAHTPQLAMAWKVPHLDPDNMEAYEPYALALLAAVLDGYVNARLNWTLVKQDRIANNIDAGYDMVARGPQLFFILGTVAKGKTVAQLENGIQSVLSELKTKGITEAELKRIQVRLLADKIYKRDSIFGQAMEIGSAEIAGVSWKSLDPILERLQTITPVQVQAVAQKYLIDDTLTVAILEPQARSVSKLPYKAF
jgi:zinc protease